MPRRMCGTHPTDPSTGRRSWLRWWLRRGAAPWWREARRGGAAALADAAPPLRGSTTADVVIVGGGYTGMWAALRLTELEPRARIVLLEADICGGGPSGGTAGSSRTGGTRRRRSSSATARTAPWRWAEAMDAAVDEIGAWCAAHGVDAWFTKAGSLSVSAAPAQDGGWDGAVAALRRLGIEGAVRAAHRRRGRGAGPLPGVPRRGVHARRGHRPAGRLARGLRRVLLERGVAIHEGTTVESWTASDPGRLGRRRGRVGAAPRRRGRRRLPTGPRPHPRRGEGEVAGSAIVAVNAWAAAGRAFGSRLVTWSSYMVLTEPIPTGSPSSAGPAARA